MAKDSKEPVKPPSHLVEQIALKPIDNLAFEGGGVKGLVYVGALQELDKKGVLRGVKRVGGSSAGGITAMFVGLGFGISDITKEMMDMDFTKFQDAGKEFWRKMPKAGKFQDFVRKAEMLTTILSSKKKGYYKGDAFLRWAEAKIAQKLGNPNATFADLRKAMNADREGKLGLKDMMFTASNISGNADPLQIFDGDHTPNVRIADAIRATMSYPGAFEAYEIEINGIKSTFVDGGLINNFPSDHYDDERYLPEGEHLNAVGMNERTLGLRVDREDEIAKYKWVGREESGRDVSTVSGYFKGIKDAVLIDRAKVRKGGLGIIQINDCNISTLNFEANPEEKAALIKSGVKCTNEYFNLYREDAIRERKVYRNLRALYEGKSESELKTIKKALHKEIGDLTAKKEEVLQNKKMENSAEYEKKSREIQDSLHAEVEKMIALDEVMKRYELKEKEDVEFIFKRFQDLIRLQLKQVEQSAKLLDSHLSELRALEKNIKYKMEENNDRISLFQKVKKDSEINEFLKQSLAAVKKLYHDQMYKIIEIQKLKSEKDKLKEASNKPMFSRQDIIRLKHLRKELYEAEHRLSESFIEEQKRIRSGLGKFLKQKVQDKKLSDKEALTLSGIVADEIIQVHSKEKPSTYEEYENQLLETQKQLEEYLKKADLDKVYQNYAKMIETHRSTLRLIQENRAVMGENPSKMLEVSFKLSTLMKSQESIGPAIGRGILFLAGNVFSLAYLGAKAAIKKWGSPGTYKKLIEDFEDKFKTNKEIFVERAESLKMEIENKQVEFSTMKAPTKNFEEYMKLLQEAMDLAIRLPTENRQEYQSFLESEKTRAEKEKKRIGREVSWMERGKQKSDQEREQVSDQSKDDKPKISPLKPHPFSNSKH